MQQEMHGEFIVDDGDRTSQGTLLQEGIRDAQAPSASPELLEQQEAVRVSAELEPYLLPLPGRDYETNGSAGRK